MSSSAAAVPHTAESTSRPPAMSYWGYLSHLLPQVPESVGSGSDPSPASATAGCHEPDACRNALRFPQGVEFPFSFLSPSSTVTYFFFILLFRAAPLQCLLPLIQHPDLDSSWIVIH